MSEPLNEQGWFCTDGEHLETRYFTTISLMGLGFVKAGHETVSRRVIKSKDFSLPFSHTPNTNSGLKNVIGTLPMCMPHQEGQNL